METVILVAAAGLLCMGSFVIGVVAGRGVPVGIGAAPCASRKERREALKISRQEREIYNMNLHNIDVYDGTEAGQTVFGE